MSTFEVDPWEAAKQHYEREMRMFMSRLMRHFGVTQIELPMYPVGADELVERCEMPDKNAVFYRIKGQLALAQRPEARTIPEVLFDGPAVYDALLDAERYHTSPQNVSAVLDAIVRIMRGSMNNGGMK